jgi:hypothetical protein
MSTITGSMTNETRVSLPEMLIITCRALANAKTTLTRFKIPKPKRSLTWRRSPELRLMISPAESLR